jgi:hypothetical protein
MLQFIALDLKKKKLKSGLIDRTVIDIPQLGCPELADISLPTISWTFECHNKPKHVCALGTTYSLSQWLNHYILSLKYATCPLQPVIIKVFHITGLLCRRYYLNEKEKRYVSNFFNNDDLKPHGKTGTFSGHAVLNEIQWFTLATFKIDVPKNEVHELGDSQHTLAVYCGRYMSITSDNTQVYLSKKAWSQLMDLRSGCIDTEVIK